MFITEVQANGNGRQVMRSAQSELQKRNAICRQVMRPPPQSELRKRNAICVLITEFRRMAMADRSRGLPRKVSLRKRNATCVFRTEVPANRNSRKQGCDGGRIGSAPLRLSFDVYVSSIPLVY